MEYWEERYRREGEIWGDRPSLTAERAAELFAHRGVRSVLIPGAGYGRNARFFKAAGFAVTGVEISAEALRLAREHCDGIEYIHGSFLDVPLEGRAFEAIYCFNTLHLFTADARRRFLARCRDLLCPGGLAYFVVFSEEDPGYGRGNRVEDGTYESKPGRPVHYFSDLDLREHFADFEILEAGLIDDPEDHGEEGPHVHRLRFILAANQ